MELMLQGFGMCGQAVSSFRQETGLLLSAGGLFCLVSNLKPSTAMLCSSLALAHLSDLLITQYPA